MPMECRECGRHLLDGHAEGCTLAPGALRRLSPLLRHWYWWLREPPYNGLFGMGGGSWRVRYPDGRPSVTMPYGDALTYLHIGGGALERVTP